MRPAARGRPTALRELRRVATAPIDGGGFAGGGLAGGGLAGGDRAGGDRVGGDLAGSDLARIAEVALALESPGDAAAIYERLASQEPARRREWALLAGRWYRAAGHLPESAMAYLAASAAAGPHDDGAADLLDGD